jgi:uncharacterized protein (DUF58 family)
MRLTHRDTGALVVVVVAIALAWLSGERALNAVAAPLLAALAFGVVAVWRAPEPTVTYGRIQSGYPGDERTLTVDVDGAGLLTFDLAVPDGIAATDVETVVSPPETVERSVRLGRRGIYSLDPPRLTQRDPLGFVERPVEATATTDFVVYPRVYEMDDSALTELFTDDLAAERQQFDRLREYQPGDPLKNVHWNSSAKRDDLLVMEFAAADQEQTIHIAAEATEGHADEMAGATATLALQALDAGLTVGLTVPGGSVAPGEGDEHRSDLLDLLARTDAGHLPTETRAGADVVVTVDSVGRTVRLAGREQDFDAVFGSTDRSPDVVS